MNGAYTDWFDVTKGLRQGCLLSPMLHVFNLYINDLVTYIKTECNGIEIGGENVCLLMYADDLVLLAKSEKDLQLMLDKLNDWCEQWKVTVNTDKSEVVHFRPNQTLCSNYKFCIGNHTLKVVPKYRYLGLVLEEHLDFSVTADHVAKSAG